MRNNKWSIEEDKILIDNYPIFGIDYCLKILYYRTKKSLFSRCNQLKLKLTDDTKHQIFKISRKKSTNYNVNHLQFTNITTKEVSYILGFIWADGFIGYEPIKKGKTKFVVGVSINTKDKNEIYEIFQKTGDWKLYESERYDKRTKKYYNNSCIQTCNEYLVEFLLENDYDKKSTVSPHKILNNIPDNLKSHFYRGFSDGDGSYYNNKRVCQYILSGHYSQNWDWIEMLLTNLNIKYSKNYQKTKKGDSSKIKIVNINGIKKFSEFMYNNWCDVGLNRKFTIYQDILRLNIKSVNFWRDEEKFFLFENYKKFGVKFCSEILNRNENSVRVYYCKHK